MDPVERPATVAGASLLERVAPLLAGLLLVAVVLASIVVVVLTNGSSPRASPLASPSSTDDDVATDVLPDTEIGTIIRPPAGGAGPADAGSGTADSGGVIDTGVRPSCVADEECVAWTVEHPGRGPVWRDASVDGDLLVLTDRLGTTALDVGDGSTRWRIEADPTAETGARGHAISDSLVVLVERDGVLRAYDRSTGGLRWISPLPAALRVRHAVDHDDVVVVVTDAVAGAAGAVRLVAGFDRDTGERRWLRRATSAASTTVGPVVFDGPGTLRGLDPVTGSVRWETPVDGPLGSVVGVGASAVHVGWEQTVVADAASGESTVTRGPPPALVTARHAEAVVLLDDDRIEFVTATGSRWAVPAPADACCATVLDDEVIVVDGDGGRTVLAGDDGSVLERRTGRGGGIFAGPAWLVAASGHVPPGRQTDADPEILALRVFDARGGRGVATTPPGVAIAGLADGVVVAGAGWVSRIRTETPDQRSG